MVGLTVKGREERGKGWERGRHKAGVGLRPHLQEILQAPISTSVLGLATPRVCLYHPAHLGCSVRIVLYNISTFTQVLFCYVGRLTYFLSWQQNCQVHETVSFRLEAGKFHESIYCSSVELNIRLYRLLIFGVTPFSGKPRKVQEF